MNKAQYLILFLPILFLLSCREKIQPISLKNVSLTTGFDTSLRLKKGLILISSKSGCSMCELFEIDLMRDEEYAKEIFGKFVIQRVDQNTTGSKWLSRILNTGSFPTYLFFDDSKTLRGIEVGAISKEKMMMILKKIQDRKSGLIQALNLVV